MSMMMIVITTTRTMVCLQIILLLFLSFSDPSYSQDKATQEHLSGITKFKNSIVVCQQNLIECSKPSEITKIINLSAKIANEFAVLLLNEGLDDLFTDALRYLPVDHMAHQKLVHMKSIIHFSQGYVPKAQEAWAIMNSSDLPSKRSLAVQMIMVGHEVSGFAQFKEYCDSLLDSFGKIIEKAAPKIAAKAVADVMVSKNSSQEEPFRISKSSSSPQNEELLMNVFLTEVQGGVHLSNKRSDVLLCTHELRPIDAELRFGLGVGLAKLGLYDLSLRHVSMSATPWESPLYRLRAMLVFQPVHESVRSLAMTVDNFEKQGEMVLLENSRNNRALGMMEKVCNSLNKISLAIQALPLLHLAGYSSPRDELVIGHSAVALPVLLSEVYSSMCLSNPVPSQLVRPKIALRKVANAPTKARDDVAAKRRLQQQMHGEAEEEVEKGHKGGGVGQGGLDEKGIGIANNNIALGSTSKLEESTKMIRIGFISGSFDGLSGKIVLAMITAGIVDRIKEEDNIMVVLTAMCLPTPRSHLTDMANSAFHHHVNLPPENKTEAILRIRQSKQDFLVFADAGLDSRVFALAHERMAPYQAIMYGWGGTLGIPAIDYYLVPETLWSGASCALMKAPEANLVNLEDDDPEPIEKYNVAPQDLFHEQVILLDELPFLPLGALSSQEELASVMKDRFRVPPLNESHVYLFPGSVRHMHPEFDVALSILLRTDQKSYVIVTLPRMGRDGLPTTHFAGRHDLMHPTHPPATVEKLKQRLRKTLGAEAASRVRILPPLDERIFSSLLLHVVAVLDPFPVGMHVSITEALMRGVPVVSAPKMQECTNSHTFGIASVVGIKGPGFSRDDWPSSAEEYAVLALDLQGNRALRQDFLPPMTRDYGSLGLLAPTWTNPKKHTHEGLRMLVDLVQRLE